MSQAAPSRDAARRRRRRRPLLLALALLVVVLACSRSGGLQEAARRHPGPRRRSARCGRRPARWTPATSSRLRPRRGGLRRAPAGTWARRRAPADAAAAAAGRGRRRPRRAHHGRRGRRRRLPRACCPSSTVRWLWWPPSRRRRPGRRPRRVSDFADVVTEAARPPRPAASGWRPSTPTACSGPPSPPASAVDGLVELDDQLAEADAAHGRAVPALGADGPRTYLLAAQNLAEARPTGGLIGCWALLRSTRAASTWPRPASTTTSRRSREAPRPAPDESGPLRPGPRAQPERQPRPRLPARGRPASDLWTAQGRPAPDGVVGIDPVALARVLGPPARWSCRADRADRNNLVQVVQPRRTAPSRRRPARQAYLSPSSARSSTRCSGRLERRRPAPLAHAP